MAMNLIKNPAVKHYFKTGLKKNHVFFIACLVLNLISFPLTLLFMAIEENSNTLNPLYLSEMFAALSLIFTGVSILTGVIIAINNFSYLHKKHESDTYMSFPLSNRQRFFCDYFSGLLSYIVPMIIAGIVCVIISFITMASVEDYSYFVIETTSESLAAIVFKCYFFGVICMIMLYTLSVLSCTLCGSLFETALNALLINGAIPGMIALLTFISFNHVSGINVSKIMLPLLSKTSPIGAVVSLFSYGSFIGSDVFEFVFILKFTFWLVLFTAGYTALSYLLYVKRKAESISKPYVFKAYYYIIISCITFALCSIIPIQSGLLFLPMLLVSTVAYLILEAITNRGLKNFKYSILRCFSTIACSLVLIVILNTPWGFGAATRVPEVDSVKSVSIDYLGVIRDSSYFHTKSISFEDKEAIEIITKLHEDIVNRTDFEIGNYSGIFEDYDYLDYYDNTYTITYKLKNGSSFSRSYPLNRDDIYTLTQLEVIDEFAQEISKLFKKELNGSHYIVFNTTYGEVNGISTGKDYYNTGNSGNISKSEFKKLVDNFAKAIEADLSERTLEDVRNPRTPYGHFTLGGTRIYVYETDKRIVSLLKESGLLPYTTEEYFEKNFEVPIIHEINMVDIEKQPEYLELGWVSQMELAYYDFDRNSMPMEYYELQKELLLNMVPYNFTEQKLYFIQYIGDYTCWYIPKSLDDKANQLYKLSEKLYHEKYYPYYEDELQGDLEQEPLENEENSSDEFDDAA